MKNKLLVGYVYATLLMFLLEDVLSIGVSAKEVLRYYVIGIPLRDLALMIANLGLVIGVVIYKNHSNTKFVFFYLLFFLYYLAIGVVNYGEYTNTINADVRILLWVTGGMSIGQAVSKIKNKIFHLKVILMLATFLCIASTLLAPDFALVMLGQSVRLSSPGTYGFGLLMILPIILLLNASDGSSNRIMVVFYIMIFMVFTAIMTNTRSQFILSVLLIILVIQSYKYEIVNNSLTLRKVGPKAKLIISLVVVAAVVLTFKISKEEEIARLGTIFNLDIISEDSRAYEIKDLIEQLSVFDVFVGRGLGGAIRSSIYDYDPTIHLHVGIMNVLLKFGIFVMMAVILFLYLYLPFVYIRSFAKNTSGSAVVSYADEANIIVLPLFFPWIISLLLSGGFSELNSLIVGVAIYLYKLIKTGGLKAYHNAW